MELLLEQIQMAQQGDVNIKSQIVEENSALVWSIVKRFNNRGHELEDLFQIGCIGLLKSIDKFDFNYNVKFSTYAFPLILGEIKRFLRDDGMVKVSRSMKEIATKARMTKESLIKRLNREPTIQELSNELKIEREELVMALESNTQVESLYSTIYQDDGKDIYLIDKISSAQNECEQNIDLILLKQSISKLKEREKKIIILRYFKDKTQVEVSKVLGISQVQVSRLEKKILKEMQTTIG